ncbi:MAG TPA: molybdenum cofactor biosynthesis protein MoaE [Verrucomicrobiae bacterium]|nr:molybdenum cofactor biosynthesis protein MoaE [Verrucomicrobiae bacterium]
MKITLQFFSFFRQIAGCNEMPIELPDDAEVGDALAQIYARFPRLKEIENATLMAVGVEFANRATKLRDGDVLSLMPPLQGGVDDELLITDLPIDASEAEVGAAAHDVGGIAVFWGVVRDVEDEQPIRALEYTAYREMAEHQFQELLKAVHEKWPVKRIRVVHRLGIIPAGEASLLVRVEAAHRGEAFAAAQFIIDELKQKVPIWKKPAGP